MGYLALTYPPGVACEAFDAMVAEIAAGGDWTLAHRSFRLAVFTEGEAPPPVAPLIGDGGAAGALIGRAFDRAATTAGEVAPARMDGLAEGEPLAACQRLIEQSWGSYIAVWVGHPHQGPTVLRDPSGGLEALAWRRDGVSIIGSRVVEGRAGPVGLAIDWNQVVRILDDPISAALAAPPLSGLSHLEPGAALHGQALAEKTALWSPAAVVRAARRPWPTRQDLRRTVDACVRALAQGEAAIVCEVSGGLDSAIVATSLAASGLGPQAMVNFYSGEAEADERRYASAVADQIGAPLRTVRRTPFVLDETSLARSGEPARPNFNGIDNDYDAGLVAALEAAGAKALFTGHGGDTVFYQVAASALAAELLRGAPCEGSRIRRLEEVARRTRRSVWSLAKEALTLAPSRLSTEAQLMAQDASRRRLAGPSHAWLADLKGISPAKRQQITALASNLNANGATGRGRLARIVHPLLAQPVVELCLAVPAPVLSAGEQERSLAREAFADRLPALIVERRSKGNISVFLGRSLAASATFLRDFLLGGRLASRGLIDVAALEAGLEPQALVWKDASREILAAATLEAWVRHWEARIAAAADPAVSSPVALAGRKASARKAKAR